MLDTESSNQRRKSAGTTHPDPLSFSRGGGPSSLTTAVPSPQLVMCTAENEVPKKLLEKREKVRLWASPHYLPEIRERRKKKKTRRSSIHETPKAEVGSLREFGEGRDTGDFTNVEQESV